MSNALDHALAIFLIAGIPVGGWLFAGRLLGDAERPGHPHARLRLYALILVTLLAATGVVIAQWILLRRGWGEIGLEPVRTPGLVGVAFGLAIFLLFVLRAGPDERRDQGLRRRLASAERLMPHTARELRAYAVLVPVAAACGEILYRGFLVRWLATVGLGLLPAAAVSAIVFGLAHLYQGTRGMLLNAVRGAFLAAVYLLSGSLFAGMVIHAAMELHSGLTLQRLYERESGVVA